MNNKIILFGLLAMVLVAGCVNLSGRNDGIYYRININGTDVTCDIYIQSLGNNALKLCDDNNIYQDVSNVMRIEE